MIFLDGSLPLPNHYKEKFGRLSERGIKRLQTSIYRTDDLSLCSCSIRYSDATGMAR